MPYKSSAQQRYFHYLESKGKMPKKTVKEFDDATDFEHLPEHKMAYGGMVEDEEMGEPEYNIDVVHGNATDFDSSGEPHTEDEYEDSHPMEYMNKGGMVRRMSRGGRMPSPSFAKALRRGY